MYRLIEFLRRSYVTLLFIIIEIVAIDLYMHSTLYTRARMLSKVYAVCGWMSATRTEIVSYFSLARENRQLTERLALLEAETVALREIAGDEIAAPEDFPYTFIAARVVSNSISKSSNRIIVNKGFNDGVLPESVIVTPSGSVAGYILECSDNYSVAESIISTDFRTIGKIEGSEYLGKIEWRGTNSHEVLLTGLSKYAEPEVGQRVMTGGSYYYAPDILIGTVAGLELDPVNNLYNVTVSLDVDMSSLCNVLIVRNQNLEEVKMLEESALKNN